MKLSWIRKTNPKKLANWQYLHSLVIIFKITIKSLFSQLGCKVFWKVFMFLSDEMVYNRRDSKSLYSFVSYNLRTNAWVENGGPTTTPPNAISFFCQIINDEKTFRRHQKEVVLNRTQTSGSIISAVIVVWMDCGKKLVQDQILCVCMSD